MPEIGATEERRSSFSPLFSLGQSAKDRQKTKERKKKRQRKRKRKRKAKRKRCPSRAQAAPTVSRHDALTGTAGPTRRHMWAKKGQSFQDSFAKRKLHEIREWANPASSTKLEITCPPFSLLGGKRTFSPGRAPAAWRQKTESQRDWPGLQPAWHIAQI